MHTETTQNQSTKNPSSNFTGKKAIIIFAAIAIILISLFIYYKRPIKKPLPPTIALLQEQGYSINIGLSGLLQPGTIIRTIESASDGTEQQLASPLIFYWADDCFPNSSPQQSPFLLPQTQGKSSATLSFGMHNLGTLLPTLQLANSAATDYRLSFKNCRLLSFAEGELNRNLSKNCIESLKNALRDGKKSHWFSVITKAIAVDSFTFEIIWKEDLAAESRLEIQENIKQVLGNSVASKNTQTPKLEGEADIALQSETSQKTVFHGTGNLIIAYHARALQPVHSE